MMIEAEMAGTGTIDTVAITMTGTTETADTAHDPPATADNQ